MDIKATQVHHVLVFSLVSRILLQITYHILKCTSQKPTPVLDSGLKRNTSKPKLIYKEKVLHKINNSCTTLQKNMNTTFSLMFNFSVVEYFWSIALLKIE